MSRPILALSALLLLVAPCEAQRLPLPPGDDTRPVLPSWPVHLIGASVGAGAVGSLGWLVGEEEGGWLVIFTKEVICALGIAGGAWIGALAVGRFTQAWEPPALTAVGTAGGAMGAGWIILQLPEHTSVPVRMTLLGVGASVGAATGAFLGRSFVVRGMRPDLYVAPGSFSLRLAF